MRAITLRRCVGATPLAVLPFQNVGCAVSTYHYERHPLPGDVLDTMAIRQLFGESVRVVLRSGTTMRLDDVRVQGDTLFGEGYSVPPDSTAAVPLDGIAQISIRRADRGADLATRGANAYSITMGVVAVGAVVVAVLCLKLLGDLKHGASGNATLGR